MPCGEHKGSAQVPLDACTAARCIRVQSTMSTRSRAERTLSIGTRKVSPPKSSHSSASSSATNDRFAALLLATAFLYVSTTLQVCARISTARVCLLRDGADGRLGSDGRRPRLRPRGLDRVPAVVEHEHGRRCGCTGQWERRELHACGWAVLGDEAGWGGRGNAARAVRTSLADVKSSPRPLPRVSARAATNSVKWTGETRRTKESRSLQLLFRAGHCSLELVRVGTAISGKQPAPRSHG